MPNSSQQEFARLIRTYLNADSPLVEDLRRYLQANGHLEAAVQFRMELAKAILYDSISPEEYERLTFEEFDSQDALREWFTELWHNLYGSVPVIEPE